MASMAPIVLLTGAAGYVGGRITEHLKADSAFEVRTASRRDGFDLLSPESCREYCQDAHTIIHLAAVNEIESLETPLEALRINGLGTVTLLRAAIEAKVQRFIYFSTAHVYGSPLVGHIDERTLTRPIHPYAITHHVAEEFVLAAHDQKQIQGLVLRLSNGFGAPTDARVNRWTLLANDLCREAVTRKTLTLKTAGLQQRNFVTLEDVSQAVSHFLRLDDWQDGLFNLGGPESFAVYDFAVGIAERCATLFGCRPQITRPAPSLGEESVTLNYDIEKLLSTGFKPANSIDAEIDATLIFCRKHFA